MDTRLIGSLEVSVVGLGCNNFGRRLDEQATRTVVHAALDAGITLFDTADIYGDTASEEYLGRALGSRRDEAVVATKFGSPLDDQRAGASAPYIERAIEDSLRRLGTDRIDLYQLHFPDSSTPIEETLGALDQAVSAGKVREVGCSNFSSALIDAAALVSAVFGVARFASVQNEYSLLNRRPERRVLPACVRHGLAFIPYFPLANGLLTGKYRRGAAPPAESRLATAPAERAAAVLSDRNFDTVETLEAWAHGRGHSLLELAVSWLLHRPAVATVIAGATSPEQVRANAAAAGWHLGADDLAELDTLAPDDDAGAAG